MTVGPRDLNSFRRVGVASTVFLQSYLRITLMYIMQQESDSQGKRTNSKLQLLQTHARGVHVQHSVIARNSGHLSLPVTAVIFRKQDGGNYS